MIQMPPTNHVASEAHTSYAVVVTPDANGRQTLTQMPNNVYVATTYDDADRITDVESA